MLTSLHINNCWTLDKQIDKAMASLSICHVPPHACKVMDLEIATISKSASSSEIFQLSDSSVRLNFFLGSDTLLKDWPVWPESTDIMDTTSSR